MRSDNPSNFRFPADYLRLSSRGVLDYESESYMQLTHVRWYFAGKAAANPIPDSWRTIFHAFGQNLMGDRWCWVTDWPADHEFSVAFCPVTASAGVGYAPHFRGAVYRLLLEELDCSHLADGLQLSHDQLKLRLRRYVSNLGDIFPSGWIDTLLEAIGRRPLEDGDGLHFLRPGELDELIARDLQFNHLDEEIDLYQ